MHGYLTSGMTFIKKILGLCIKVGQDPYGNRYYQERYFFLSRKRYPKRWVLYKGQAEGSKVPADWHGWLHYTTDHEPSRQRKPYAWEKPSLPNLSGTPYAYKGKRPLNVKFLYKTWTDK